MLGSEGQRDHGGASARRNVLPRSVYEAILDFTCASHCHYKATFFHPIATLRLFIYRLTRHSQFFIPHSTRFLHLLLSPFLECMLFRPQSMRRSSYANFCTVRHSILLWWKMRCWMPFAATSTPCRKQQSRPKVQGLPLKICAQTFPICISLVLGPCSHLLTTARQQIVDQRLTVFLAKTCWKASMKVSKRVRNGRRKLIYLFGADFISSPIFSWHLTLKTTLLALQYARAYETPYSLEAVSPTLECWPDMLWQCHPRQSTGESPVKAQSWFRSGHGQRNQSGFGAKDQFCRRRHISCIPCQSTL